MNFKIAIKNLFKDYWGSISLVYILIITLISIFAYWISQIHRKCESNEFKIHSKPPGFSTFKIKIPQNLKIDNSF